MTTTHCGLLEIFASGLTESINHHVVLDYALLVQCGVAPPWETLCLRHDDHDERHQMAALYRGLHDQLHEELGEEVFRFSADIPSEDEDLPGPSSPPPSPPPVRSLTPSSDTVSDDEDLPGPSSPPPSPPPVRSLTPSSDTVSDDEDLPGPSSPPPSPPPVRSLTPSSDTVSDDEDLPGPSSPPPSPPPVRSLTPSSDTGSDDEDLPGPSSPPPSPPPVRSLATSPEPSPPSSPPPLPPSSPPARSVTPSPTPSPPSSPPPAKISIQSTTSFPPAPQTPTSDFPPSTPVQDPPTLPSFPRPTSTPTPSHTLGRNNTLPTNTNKRQSKVRCEIGQDLPSRNSTKESSRDESAAAAVGTVRKTQSGRSPAEEKLQSTQTQSQTRCDAELPKPRSTPGRNDNKGAVQTEENQTIKDAPRESRDVSPWQPPPADEQMQDVLHVHGTLEYRDGMTSSRQLFDDRRFVKEGDVRRHSVSSEDTARLISRAPYFRRSASSLTLFLFDNSVVLAKKKGASYNKYTVKDHCASGRATMREVAYHMSAHLDEWLDSNYHQNMMLLVLEANHKQKRVEMVLSCNSEQERREWLDLMAAKPIHISAPVANTTEVNSSIPTRDIVIEKPKEEADARPRAVAPPPPVDEELISQYQQKQCSVCPAAIVSYIPKDGAIYCASCYEDKFADKCKKCAQAITAGGVTYDGGSWHGLCFTCSHCDKPLAGELFIAKDKKPFCADCHAQLFAQRCSACSKPMTGRIVTSAAKSWHNECFNCFSCQTSLAGRGFVFKGEDISCSNCARLK